MTANLLRNVSRPLLALAAAASLLMLWSHVPTAQQQRGGTVALDADDIGGVVSSAKGPEAGVWVIAETTELPTKFRKIVVTDDPGRYLVPGSASCHLRGLGARLRPGRFASRSRRCPGRLVNLQATIAPTPQRAAAVYPANYWYSLIKVPEKREFPGTGPNGNGIAPGMRTQADWITQMKDGCQLCHQMGNKATREIPKSVPARSTRASKPGTAASRSASADRR